MIYQYLSNHRCHNNYNLYIQLPATLTPLNPSNLVHGRGLYSTVGVNIKCLVPQYVLCMCTDDDDVVWNNGQWRNGNDSDISLSIYWHMHQPVHVPIHDIYLNTYPVYKKHWILHKPKNPVNLSFSITAQIKVQMCTSFTSLVFGFSFIQIYA